MKSLKAGFEKVGCWVDFLSGFRVSGVGVFFSFRWSFLFFWVFFLMGPDVRAQAICITSPLYHIIRHR